MKKISILLASAFIAASLSAQDAKTVFASIPDSLSPLLSAVNRADFIDFLESNMTAKVKNKLDGQSEMTDLTDSYIRIRITDQSIWEMKLLPVSDEKKVVCVVNTACAPVCDSSIQFYTTGWEELPPTDFITLPVEDNFFNTPPPAEQDQYKQLRLKADMFLIKAELDKEAHKIVFTYTTPDYIEKEYRAKIQAYIHPRISMLWNGNKFVTTTE